MNNAVLTLAWLLIATLVVGIANFAGILVLVAEIKELTRMLGKINAAVADIGIGKP